MMHKLTKATAITLGLYIMLQSPAIIMLFVWSFVYFGHTYTGEIVSDYIYIVLYINNVVNPVIYYFTLKDCREGYKKICLCTNPNRTDRCQQFADITIVNWSKEPLAFKYFFSLNENSFKSFYCM